MIVIMLMILIIAWLLSSGIFFGLGFFVAKEKYRGKKKKAIQDKSELTDEEIYLRKKKEREEKNFWDYDGTEQDIE